MNTFVKAVCCLMVILILVSPVLGFGANTFSEALQGFEGTLSVVGKVGETTLDALSFVGGVAGGFVDFVNSAIKGTDYELPASYRSLLGADNIYRSYYASTVKDLADTIERCSLVATGIEKRTISVEETAYAAYMYDMYVVTNKLDGAYKSFERIEYNVHISAFVVLSRWLFNRQIYIDRYSSILNEMSAEFNPSLEVMIMRYEYGKEYRLDENGDLVEGVSPEWYTFKNQ